MRTLIVLTAVSALLAGCSTSQERAAYREDPVAAMAPEYGPGCEKAGYARGSTQWRSCISASSTRDDLAAHALYYDRYMAWYLLR